MTLSNKTSASSRINTYVAILLSAIALVAMVLLFVQVRKLDDEFSDLRREKPQLELEFASLLDRRDELSQQIGALESKRDSLDELESKVIENNAIIDRQTVELGQLESEAAAASMLRDSANQQVELLSSQSEEFRRVIDGLKSQQVTLNREVAAIERTWTQSDGDLNDLKVRQGLLEDEVSDLSDQKLQYSADVQRLRSEVSTLDDDQADVQQLREEKATLVASIDELQIRNDTILENNAVIENQIDNNGLILNRLNTNIAGSRARLASLEQTALEKEAQISILNSEISKNETRLEAIQQQFDASDTDLLTINSEISGLQDSRQEILSELALSRVDLDALNDNLGLAKAEYTDIRAQSSERVAQVQVLDATIIDRNDSVADLGARVELLKAQISTLQGEKASVNSAVTEANSMLLTAQDQLAEIEIAQAELLQRNAVLEASLIQLEGLKALSETELQTNNQDIAILSAQAKALREQKESLISETAEANSLRLTASNDLAMVSREVETAEIEKMDVRAQVSEILARRQILELTFSELEQSLANKQAQIAAMDNQIEALRDTKAEGISAVSEAEALRSIALHQLEITKNELLTAKNELAAVQLERDAVEQGMETPAPGTIDGENGVTE